MGLAIDYSRARRVLARRDPILRDLMRRHGPCGLADSQHTDPFVALVHAIISQQLSTKAAATIAGRVEALLGGTLEPARAASVSDVQLRGAGLSGQKIGYLRDLCRRIEDRSLPLDALEAMADEDVIAALTQVKGIGRWTAEMFLIFAMHRLDIYSMGDVGLRRAVDRLYGSGRRLSDRKTLSITGRWTPYRSVASWYLWKLTDGDV